MSFALNEQKIIFSVGLKQKEECQLQLARFIKIQKPLA